jgi:hypothetical protein
MNNTNSIAICKDKFKSQEAFQNAIRDAVMVLLNNGNIMTVRYDEPGLGIVVIDYNSDDQALGEDYPYWLSPEEWESVDFEA